MKKQHVELTDADYTYVHNLLSKGSLRERQMKRCRALLELNKGKTYIAVMDIINVSNSTLISWSKKYKAAGLSFLEEKPRSGRPLGLSGADRAKITLLACSTPPEGYARWSLRLLADKLVELEMVESISFKQVGNILKKMNYNLTVKDSGVSAK